MTDNNFKKNDFNSFDEFGEFRFREKRKRPIFSDNKDNEELYSKKSNRGEVFTSKVFKPDSENERKVFKLKNEYEKETLLKTKEIYAGENDNEQGIKREKIKEDIEERKDNYEVCSNQSNFFTYIPC